MKDFTISLKVGGFAMVADGPIWSKGRTNPDGSPDTHPPEAEHDYFELFYLKNLRVEDADGNVVSPIIRELAFVNSGYVLTFSATFWREGFAIENGNIVFVSKGEDSGYYGRKTVVNKLSSGAGQSCSREELDSFLSGTPEVVDGDREKELRKSLLDQYSHSIHAFQTNGEVNWLNEDDLEWDGSVLHVKVAEEILW